MFCCPLTSIITFNKGNMCKFPFGRTLCIVNDPAGRAQRLAVRIYFKNLYYELDYRKLLLERPSAAPWRATTIARGREGEKKEKER